MKELRDKNGDLKTEIMGFKSFPSSIARKDWRKLKYVTFDLEGTSVNPYDSRMVQFACSFNKVGEDGALVADSFSIMINPGQPIDPESTAIHHITDEMVKDCYKLSDIYEDTGDTLYQYILDWLSCGDFLNAYNGLIYDAILLEEEGKRIYGNNFETNFPIIDPIIFRRESKTRAKMSGNSLEKAANDAGVGKLAQIQYNTEGMLHKADTDVEVAADLLSEYAKSIIPSMTFEKTLELQLKFFITHEKYYSDKYGARPTGPTPVSPKDKSFQELNLSGGK